jgi:hypothetical protein
MQRSYGSYWRYHDICGYVPENFIRFGKQDLLLTVNLSLATGLQHHPRKVRGYSRVACRRVLDHFKEHTPRRLALIVNLGHHFRKGRKLTDGHRTLIENIVPRRGRRTTSTEPKGCDGLPNGAFYEMAHPGPGAAAQAHTVGICPDPTCPTLRKPSSQPLTCIPNGTSVNPSSLNALNLVPDYKDIGYSDFEEFVPEYGEGTGTGWYDFMQSLDDTSLFLKASDEAPFNGRLWSGCDQDRAGDYDGLAELLTDYLIEKGVTLAADLACEFVDDSIDIPIFAITVSLPNPLKIVCVVARAIFQFAELGLETILEQVDFQNGIVDAVEIQAGKSTRSELNFFKWNTLILTRFIHCCVLELFYSILAQYQST